MVDKVAK